MPPTVCTVDRSETIGDSELYVLDVNQSFAFYAYEFAAARCIGAAGRRHRSRASAFSGLQDIAPSCRDLRSNVREVHLEEEWVVFGSSAILVVPICLDHTFEHFCRSGIPLSDDSLLNRQVSQTVFGGI